MPSGETFAWDPKSTYVKHPPYFEGMPIEPGAVNDISGARVLLKLGHSITTDHISPAGSIKPDSPAGKYLVERGVSIGDFNSYGSRRGNHEVMVRGTSRTFACATCWLLVPKVVSHGICRTARFCPFTMPR